MKKLLLFVTGSVLLAFSFAALPARAAITSDLSSITGTSVPANPASFSWTQTNGAGADRMLVVGVTTESSADVAITSVTFAGVAMTHVPSGRAVNNAAAFDAADMWYMANPPLGVGTIVVTVPANAATAGAVGVAISLFGVKPAGPEAVATYGDVAGSNGRFQFTDTNAYQFSQCYYGTLIP